MGGITTAFVEKEILKKLRICPLALFCSSGIFYLSLVISPAMTNAGSLSSGKVKSENGNKKFSKKLLTKTKTALR